MGEKWPHLLRVLILEFLPGLDHAQAKKSTIHSKSLTSHSAILLFCLGEKLYHDEYKHLILRLQAE
jgi:hypothetical protein